LELFKRVFIGAIHNAVVMYRSFPNNKNIDELKFRLSLAQGSVEKHGSGVSLPVHGHPSIELLSQRLTEQFMDHIPASRNNGEPCRCTGYGKRR
jgi:hypothetical protein